MLVWILLAASAAATAPQPCTNVKNAALCRDLLGIYARHAAAHDAGADAANLERVELILRQFGWPGNSLVGEKASAAAWTIIQNASLATQKKYIDVMTDAAAAHELSPALLAATIDRMAVRQGRPQVYGTEPNAPVEDQEHVNERRARVGLPPLPRGQ